MARHLLLDGEQPMTVREVAAFLGVEPRTVGGWRRKGRIPEDAVAVEDGVFWYSAPAIRALRDEREVKP